VASGCPRWGAGLSVAVVTDSAASLPVEVAARAGIRVVPMWLTIGEVTVRDNELDLAEVVARSSHGFSTAGPTPGELADAVAGADRGDGVVVVTLAAAMSATNNSARLAASLIGPDRVRVVDSGTAAGAEGLVALATAEAAAGGADLDGVVAAADRARERVRLVATVPSLEHLARSGRVPGAAAWAGRALSVNPLFEFRRGGAHPLRPAIGRSHAFERIIAIWDRDRPASGRLHLAGMHALDPDAAERLVDSVRERVAPNSTFIGSFSPVMVAHTGPGVVGLAWWWEPDPAEPAERAGRSPSAEPGS
jgi:DegV family protein with EDD domain